MDKDEICWNDVFQFIEYAHSNGFSVNFMALEPTVTVCYADNLSEVIINYDGNVFKCTARDFSSTEPDGILLENGAINWDVSELTRRLYTQLTDICLDCKRLPSCPSLCSQKIIEGNGDVKCMLDTNLSIDDYIVYNFNRYAIKSGIIMHEKR